MTIRIASKLALAVLLVSALPACAEGPGEQKSLRASIADWIAPPGYTPNGGPYPVPGPAAQAQAETVQRSYQGDAARQQAGIQSVTVSQVTIFGGGQVNVHVGGFPGSNEWRPASNGVVTATVAECESVAVMIPRADKPGGATVYLTRVNGIIFASQFGTSGCQMPGNAQSFPGYGQFPLQVQGRVMGATIRISPWGSAAGYYPPSYNPY